VAGEARIDPAEKIDCRASAYAVRSAISRDETGLNPRQRHRSNENTVAEIIPGDGILG